MTRSILCLLAVLVVLAAPLVARADNSFGLRDTEAKLRLDARQKVLFDDAVSATKRALLATAIAGNQVKAQIGDELGKAHPDPFRMLVNPDDIAGQLRAPWRESHEAWTRLYATLDERQLAIARREIEQRIQLIEVASETFLKGFAIKPGR
jgi:hypothetical protein